MNKTVERNETLVYVQEHQHTPYPPTPPSLASRSLLHWEPLGDAHGKARVSHLSAAAFSRDTDQACYSQSLY
jgi:hypothetical protein